jgi:hypothetical protein
MTPLIHSKHTDLVYLINGSAYPWLYSKLARILTAEEIRYFASVEILRSEGRWNACHEGDFVPYNRISEADREFIIDDLDYLHTAVRQKIAADPELKRFVNELLVIPAQEQIFVYHDVLGMPKITLAQWGCSLPRSPHGFDPIGLIIKERKKTHTRVTLAIQWTGGDAAANIPFQFSYKYSVLEKNSEDDGLAHLGLLKNGTKFTVVDINKPAMFDFTFEVIPDQTVYTIVIPYYTSVEVRIIDQLKQAVAGCNIRAMHGDDHYNVYVADEHGKFRIERILHDDRPLILSFLPDNKINREYILTRKHNNLVFEIYRTITGIARINVVNRLNNTPVADHIIKIKSPADTIEAASDSVGVVALNAMEAGTLLTVTDASDEYNYKDFTVEAGDNEFIFPIELPIMLTPHITTVNKKNNSLVGAYPLKVKIAGVEREMYSNREGIIALGNIEQGVKISVTDSNDQYNNAEFVVNINSAEFIFPVELPEIFTLRILVVNKNDMTTPVDAYPVKVNIADNAQEMFSNRDGIITLGDMKKDIVVSLIDGNNPYNNMEFTTDAETHEYIFAVEPPVGKTVRIKLIKNKEIMPNHIIDVVINGTRYKRTTDEEGKISLPESLFTHGKKVKVEIPINRNNKKEQ